jgi:antitoxin HigA-1
MRDEGYRLKNPPHPGSFVREILEGQELSILQAAEVLEVRRQTLSNLVNQLSDLSPEMALRLEKAFDVSMETLMRMQNSYDIAKARAKEGEITVKRYIPKLKDAAQPSLP